MRQGIGEGVEASIALSQRISGCDEVRLKLSCRYKRTPGICDFAQNAGRPNWLRQTWVATLSRFKRGGGK